MLPRFRVFKHCIRVKRLESLSSITHYSPHYNNINIGTASTSMQQYFSSTQSSSFDRRTIRRKTANEFSAASLIHTTNDAEVESDNEEFEIDTKHSSIKDQDPLALLTSLHKNVDAGMMRPVVDLEPIATRSNVDHRYMFHSNEIVNLKTHKSKSAHCIVNVAADSGGQLGSAFLSLNKDISLMRLSTNAFDKIDANWVSNQLNKAFQLRRSILSIDELLNGFCLCNDYVDGLPGIQVEIFFTSNEQTVFVVNITRDVGEMLFPKFVEALYLPTSYLSGDAFSEQILASVRNGANQTCMIVRRDARDRSTDQLCRIFEPQAIMMKSFAEDMEALDLAKWYALDKEQTVDGRFKHNIVRIQSLSDEIKTCVNGVLASDLVSGVCFTAPEEVLPALSIGHLLTEKGGLQYYNDRRNVRHQIATVCNALASAKSTNKSFHVLDLYSGGGMSVVRAFVAAYESKIPNKTFTAVESVSVHDLHATLAKHNLTNKIIAVQEDPAKFIKTTEKLYDVVIIDPPRRRGGAKRADAIESIKSLLIDSIAKTKLGGTIFLTFQASFLSLSAKWQTVAEAAHEANVRLVVEKEMFSPPDYPRSTHNIHELVTFQLRVDEMF